MPIRSVADITSTGDRILVRVDYNVDLEVLEKTGVHFKLDASKETLQFLFSLNAKVALLTHIGDPEGRDPKFSTARLIPALENCLQKKVRFVSDSQGEAVELALAALTPNEVLLLENVRFYDDEEKNSRIFAEKLAKPFNIFVNEAFGVNHRNHASLTTITKFLPSYAGLRLLKEMAELDRVRLHPEHPAVAIIGGAKIATKLPLIQALELNYDALLVGGKIANEALDRAEAFSSKVHLPSDFQTPARYDIGPKTIEEYSRIISTAQTVIWNGPMGKFEDPEHSRGTDCILHAILSSSAYSVMGGGESLEILDKNKSHDKINFVSTGGGAMLEYMSGKKLPGITALEKQVAA